MSSRAKSPAAPSDLLTSKIPPHDIPTERAVLGLMLSGPGGTALALELLTAAAFYKDSHGRLFSAIRRLSERGQAVDLLTVANALGADGDLDYVGGPAELAALVEEAALSAALPTYAERIRDCAARREAIQSATALIGRAYEPTAGRVQLQRDAEQLLESVTVRPADENVPTVERQGDTFTVTWPTTAARLVLDALDHGTDGVWAEASMINGSRVVMPPTRINLLTDTGRQVLVKRMQKASSLDWATLIESAAGAVLDAARAVNAAVRLAGC